MATNDDAATPAHFGDYQHGLYWSAERPSGVQEDEPADYSVNGPVIRVMWDYGVCIPLWDAEGLLPEEPAWLREALDLSDRLIEDLRRWGLGMEELDATPSRRTKPAYEALDVHGQELAQRLQQELGSRFVVKYHPW